MHSRVTRDAALRVITRGFRPSWWVFVCQAQPLFEVALVTVTTQDAGNLAPISGYLLCARVIRSVDRPGQPTAEVMEQNVVFLHKNFY
jgi:hypothetical protein